MKVRKKVYVLALATTAAVAGFAAAQGLSSPDQETTVADAPPQQAQTGNVPFGQEASADKPDEAPGDDTNTDFLRSKAPSLGFDVDPPDGYKPTGEPANGKMASGDLGIRIYFNESAETKVGVTVHANADFEQWLLEDYPSHEGSVRTVDPITGSLGTWELVADERGDVAWRHLVLQATDGSFVSINGWQLDDFDDLYEFAGRIFDSPGSLEPIVDVEQGELEG